MYIYDQIFYKYINQNLIVHIYIFIFSKIYKHEYMI